MPEHEARMKALIATWRKQAAGILRAGDNASPARCIQECADELEAALASADAHRRPGAADRYAHD